MTVLDNESDYGLQEVTVGCLDKQSADDLVLETFAGFREYAKAHGLPSTTPDMSLVTETNDPDWPFYVAFRFVYSKFGVRAIRGFIPDVISRGLSY